MIGTYSPTILENFIYKGKKASSIEEIPTRYFRISINCFPTIVPLEEVSDLELLSFSEKMGTFSFLDHPGEDIYNISDGMPVE